MAKSIELRDQALMIYNLKLKATSILRGVTIPLMVLLVWEIMSRQSASTAYAFASINDIYHGLIEIFLTGELWQGIRASVSRTVTGLAVGGLIGFIVGTMMALSRIAEVGIGPLYHIVRQVPLLGLAPLFSLWFGNGDTSKLIIVCISAFYPIVLATFESLNQVDKKYREVGMVYRLGWYNNFRHILLPAALPNIFTGFSLALAFAWLSSIGAEILFSAGEGLGNIMMNAQAASRMDILIVITVVIGLLGYFMNLLLNRLGRYFFRWRNIGH